MKLFYIIGPSASGKDTIFKEVSKGLEKLIPYTTRLMREGEVNGKDYHFVSKEEMIELERQGKVIEKRSYEAIPETIYYFTVAKELTETTIGIGTIESCKKLIEYYGEDVVCPVYIQVDDVARIKRAIHRESKQTSPNLQEMCRRFLADAEDFSEENLKSLANLRKVSNNKEVRHAIYSIRNYITFTNLRGEEQVLLSKEDSYEVENYEGEIVILNPEKLTEDARTAVNQVWVATHGPGCKQGSFTGTVHLKHFIDKDRMAVSREDIFGVIKPEVLQKVIVKST